MAKLGNIISVEQLENDLDEVLRLLDKKNELIVIKDNKPSFILKSIEEDQRNIEFQVEHLLQKIGKRVFVEYYYIFEEDIQPEGKLPGKFSLNSRRSRSSAARKIFEFELEREALLNIISSDRLNIDIISKAEKILSTIDNVVITKKDIKVGYMAKNIIPMMITDGLIDDEIENLTKEQESKQIFGLYYKCLLPIDFVFDARILKYDHNKYPRYYAEPISYKGKDYMLCSQWNEKLHLIKLEHWLYNIIASADIKFQNKYKEFLNLNLRRKLKI